MPPLSTTLWLFRNSGQDQPIMPEKTHIPLPAADVRRPRPYKASEINIRLSTFATNEQYHQMCGRANVMPPPIWSKAWAVQSLIRAEGVRGKIELAKNPYF